MKVKISNCARCGETHVGLEFSKLTRPMVDAKHTHWAMCPTVNEPIMLRIVEDDNTPNVESSCQHQIWSAWYSTGDQMGLISPAKDGNIYAYMRECMVAGCSAYEYAENIEPTGKRTIQKKGFHKPCEKSE